MKFLNELFQSMLKSIIFCGVLVTLILSLMQGKFPPSFSQASETYKKYSDLMATMSNFKLKLPGQDLVDKGKQAQSRADLLTETSKLDPSMQDFAELAKKADAETKNETFRTSPTKEDRVVQQGDIVKPKDLAHKDTDFIKLRLDQAEYKVRLLEYEVGVLKAELKKLQPQQNKGPAADAPPKRTN